MFKKLAIAVFVGITFLIYSLHQRSEGSAALNQVIKNNGSTSTNTSATSSATNGSSSSTSSTAPSSSSSTQASGQYKDGTYTGSQGDAFYGYIQVQITVSNGKLADLTFLQYPNDRRNSVEINNYAMPILKQQAIAAQSANVDGVSGATDTSQAFVQSLTDALSQAKA